MTRRFEVLEHTADVGLRLHGDSLEEVFRAAGEGFASLQDAWFPGDGDAREVRVLADDREGLLVTWIDELLYLQEAEDVVFGGFDIDYLAEHELRASVTMAPRGDRELEGVGVKATTYHRVAFDEAESGWSAEVYLDV